MLHDFVNLHRYPVHTEEGLAQLAQSCARSFRDEQLIVLDDFFKRDAVDRWRADLEARSPFVSVKSHTISQAPMDPALPQDHVSNRTVNARIGFVGRSKLGECHDLVQLYTRGSLLRLAVAISGRRLYSSTDTEGSIYATVNRQGFCTAWHLDQHPVSAVVSLRAVESGGEFCWLPHAKLAVSASTDCDSEERLHAVLDGTSSEVRRTRFKEG